MGLGLDWQLDFFGRNRALLAAATSESDARRADAAAARLALTTSVAETYAELGPAVTLPIFSAGRLEGAYRGARADYDAAVANYDRTLVHALQEVADSAVSARALDDRLGKSREAYSAAKAAYELTRQRYARDR